MSAPHQYNGFYLDFYDPGYMKKISEASLKFARTYFRLEVEGFENVPEGPLLAVGNHNGGSFPIDPFLFFFAWGKHFNYQRPIRGLGHDTLFKLKRAGKFMCKIGVVRANMEVGKKLLQDRKETVMVFPGGSEEAFRHYKKRHLVDFIGRKGLLSWH